VSEPRVSVVTGGSSGIGRALAIALARRGDHVVVVGRNPERLSETREALSAVGDGDALALRLDVGRPGDMAELTTTCAQRWGRVDVLIASAGIGATGRGLPPPTSRLPLAEWQAVVDVNLHGVFLSNTCLLPLIRARGGGAIINICSSTTPHGLRGQPLAPAYCATKFAVAAFSRALADDVAPDGISVSAIFPGSVETPLIANTMLDGPFGGSMSQDSFVHAVLGLLEQEQDIELPDPHILPMPRRRVRRQTLKKT
jgi:NAD(P)-dependent dehydrogenase (short-subunit alcohol dehydrogenase family)